MTEAVAQILERLPTLTQSERAELACAFLRSLEPDDPDAEAAWEVELARRVAEIRNGQAEGRPADQVFAALREQRP